VSLIAASCSGWLVFPSIGSDDDGVGPAPFGAHLVRHFSQDIYRIIEEGMLLGVGTDAKVYARLQVCVCIYAYRIYSLWNVFSTEEDLLLGVGTDAKVYAHLQVLCVYI
jgi:hypothetical protein